MKKMISSLIFRVIILSSMIIFFCLCYFRRTQSMRNNSSYNPCNSCMISNIVEPLPYLDLRPLEELVNQNSQNGPTIVSDINIDVILSKIENENKRWNISSLSKDQIRLMTNPKERHDGKKSTKQKYILFWNEAYGSTKYGFCCGSQPFSVCPKKNCYVTDNRSLLESVDQFDAIQFHQRTINHMDLPQIRNKNQRYIMWYMESADYPLGFDSSQYNNFFNWTITYRRDADFRNQYGIINKIKETPIQGTKLDSHIRQFGLKNSDISQNKTKKIAWFVSHCETKSEREKYVDELRKHIQVDIFGKCGTLSCPREDEKRCWDKIEEEYFFYLSFENSLCKDYITEKFFNPMQRMIVPVVLGGALNGKVKSSDYFEGLNTPYHSFIDARQFPKPKLLAKYLNNVYASPNLYAEYLWWKEYYSVTFDPKQVTTKTYCDLCKRLHDEPSKDSKNHHVIEDLHEFWDVKSRCQRVRL